MYFLRMSEKQETNSLTPEQKSVFLEIIEYLREAKPDYVINRMAKFHIPTEVTSYPEFREALIDGMVYTISNGFVHVGNDILKVFPLTKEEMKRALIKGIISALEFGLLDEFEAVKNSFSVSQDLLQQEDVRHAAVKAKKMLLSNQIGEKDSRFRILKENFDV